MRIAGVVVVIRRPPLFDKWNPSMRGAFRKGYEAKKAGVPQSECPYKDKRNESGRLTWSRAFQSAWRDGWEWSDSE